MTESEFAGEWFIGWETAAQPPIRLNLGCGRSPLEGWVNLDVRPGPGVDELVDLDRPRCLARWETGSVSEVLAAAILEHLAHWPDTLLEVARVLRPGGVVRIRVPYKWDFRAFHIAAFDRHTFDLFCDGVRYRGYDLRLHDAPYLSETLEQDERYFARESVTLDHWYPFAWHLAKVLGPRAYHLPFGRAHIMNVVLRRNARPWNGWGPAVECMR